MSRWLTLELSQSRTHEARLSAFICGKNFIACGAGSAFAVRRVDSRISVGSWSRCSSVPIPMSVDLRCGRGRYGRGWDTGCLISVACLSPSFAATCDELRGQDTGPPSVSRRRVRVRPTPAPIAAPERALPVVRAGCSRCPRRYRSAWPPRRRRASCAGGRR
jgi:hypothetical protein